MYAFSKGLLPRMECNFTVIVNIREEGQEEHMRVGWTLWSFVILSFFKLLRVKNPLADELAL